MSLGTAVGVALAILLVAAIVLAGIYISGHPTSNAALFFIEVSAEWRWATLSLLLPTSPLSVSSTRAHLPVSPGRSSAHLSFGGSPCLIPLFIRSEKQNREGRGKKCHPVPRRGSSPEIRDLSCPQSRLRTWLCPSCLPLQGFQAKVDKPREHGLLCLQALP